MADAVDPAEIVRQRAAGWPDLHPGDHCHRCRTESAPPGA